MTYRKLKYEYHEADLQNYEIGPGNELTLSVRLSRWAYKNSTLHVSIKFGGIRNFDDVVTFFAQLPKSEAKDRYIDEIIDIVYEPKGKWHLVLGKHGSISIHSFNYVEVGCG